MAKRVALLVLGLAVVAAGAWWALRIAKSREHSECRHSQWRAGTSISGIQPVNRRA